MNTTDFIQIAVYCVVFVGLAPLFGNFMANVFEGKPHILSPVLGWLEQGIYKVCGIDYAQKMTWKDYAKTMLWVNALGLLAVFGIQVVQTHLPLNPDALPNVPWLLALNTAISFVTNTNWQAYAGETTLSYASQLFGLTVQNFLSAATGISVLLVMIRGIRQKTNSELGNFWVDMVRSVVYVLLPLSLVMSFFLVSQGVPQTLMGATHAKTIEGATQVIARGPVASQIAIKQLGSNGGGFFNANSAHPYENPTPLSNFAEMLALLMLPAALVITFGKMLGSKKHGWVVFTVMMVMFVSCLGLSLASEYQLTPFGTPNMEGKETRFGVVNSVIWSVATTVTSNGSVNAMHGSLTPLSGGLAMFNMMLGELIFGGVGAGLLGMTLFILLTIFLAGLMIGRTPEYFGKKIGSNEMKWVILAILIPNILILAGAGISSVLPVALSSVAHKGPHGLSEILYAFSSAAGNNGSAFASLNANTNFYNAILGFVMLIGRFGVIIPCLAIAGSLTEKKQTPPSAGTFPTDGPLFGVLLLASILIVGVLTFLPALALGPVLEHLLLASNHLF